MQLLALVILGIQAQRMVPGAPRSTSAHLANAWGGLARLVGKLNLPPRTASSGCSEQPLHTLRGLARPGGVQHQSSNLPAAIGQMAHLQMGGLNKQLL